MIVKVLGGLVSSKIIALFLGPAGLALVGNLRDFISLTDSVSTLGFQQGIIKYVAEKKQDKQELNRILSTICFLLLVVILFLSTFLFLFADFLSNYYLFDYSYGWVYKVLALALPWYAGNIVLMAILNGLSRYNEVIKINIWGNVIGVGLSAILIWQFRIPGAMMGVVLPPALLFLFSFYYIRKQLPHFIPGKKDFKGAYLKLFFSYSLMALVTTVLGSAVSLYIRNSITDNFNAGEAGYWTAINRLSGYYLVFVSTLLTVYFLPKLSMSTSIAETRKVFWSYYKGIIPVFAMGLLCTYFLRYFIIRVIFSDDFMPVADLFLWQLTGDFLKVCSLILGYEFFAKKITKAFIVTETLSFLILFLSSSYLIPLYGSEGAVMAHCLTYFLYLVMLITFFRKKLF